jgi:hypothetical protein
VYGDPQVSPQPETYWGHVNPVGPRGCYDEAKRFAEAIFSNLLVEDLSDLDLSYTPPLSSPWDPIQKAAMMIGKNNPTGYPHPHIPGCMP